MKFTVYNCRELVKDFLQNGVKYLTTRMSRYNHVDLEATKQQNSWEVA